MTDYAEMPIEQAALSGMAIAAHAARKPNRTAVTDQKDQSLTWSQLNSQANQLVNYWRSLGLGINDGVALLCSNRVEFTVVFMAAFRSGIRVTPINWHLTGEEIGYIIDNCDASIFLADALFADKAIEAKSASNRLKALMGIGGEIPGFDLLDEMISAHSSSNIEDPVHGGGMLYTSGTTGRPKGVMLT